jgi:mRNA interferase MazF
MAMARRPRRGDVWSVRFDPSVGSEIRKVRPAVVLSGDSIGRLPLRIVVPVTDWQPAFASIPWFVPLQGSSTNGLTKDSGADAFQVKSVSETRFVRFLGTIEAGQVDEIAAAVALCVEAP